MPKQVQRVWNAATTVLVVLVVILALLLVGVRLVGFRPMCVLSGSMEPGIPVGAIVYDKNFAASEARKEQSSLISFRRERW